MAPRPADAHRMSEDGRLEIATSDLSEERDPVGDRPNLHSHADLPELILYIDAHSPAVRSLNQQCEAELLITSFTNSVTICIAPASLVQKPFGPPAVVWKGLGQLTPLTLTEDHIEER